jgi:hypothetical protein
MLFGLHIAGQALGILCLVMKYIQGFFSGGTRRNGVPEPI